MVGSAQKSKVELVELVGVVDDAREDLGFTGGGGCNSGPHVLRMAMD